jgi:SAM-dependent methyltransferase
MSDAGATSYDEVPYSNQPFIHAHPDTLATVARLHGHEAPAVATCRVLELGCGRGGNLIPLAYALPRGRFVGVDLSRRQIDSGLAAVRALGLTNVELDVRSITDITPDFGRFDYVLCHGVYSWVPPAVQDRILGVCAANLAPGGVAYVSYNTYPGWHLGGVVRDMLAHHARRFDGAGERLRQARAFLDFLQRSLPDQGGTYAAVVRDEARHIARQSDTYLFHEYLEEDNHPVYFHQFVARAAFHGLAYLADAAPDAVAANLSPATRAAVEQLTGALVEKEQYIDFLCARKFRRSLLVHRGVATLPAPSPDALSGLYLTARCHPLSAQPDVASDAVERFRGPDEVVTVSTNNPLLKAALVSLWEAWPRSLPFQRLWGEVLARLDRAPAAAAVERDPSRLRASLLQCQQSGLAELHVHAPDLPTEAGDRPTASAVARLQAAEGGLVTNLRHYSVQLDDPGRRLLRHLDGSRDRAALLAVLKDAGQDDASAEETLGRLLGYFVRNALLVA